MWGVHASLRALRRNHGVCRGRWDPASHGDRTRSAMLLVAMGWLCGRNVAPRDGWIRASPWRAALRPPRSRVALAATARIRSARVNTWPDLPVVAGHAAGRLCAPEQPRDRRHRGLGRRVDGEVSCLERPRVLPSWLGSQVWKAVGYRRSFPVQLARSIREGGKQVDERQLLRTECTTPTLSCRRIGHGEIA